MKRVWIHFVCAVLGHRGLISGGPIAQVLDCERCGRRLRIGVD